MAIENFLLDYGSAVVLPLAVVEGPIVSVVTGVLSARGFLDWYWAVALLVCADLIGDLGYYWIGRAGKTRIGMIGRALRIERAFTPELQRGLAENATKMMLVGKWTHAIGWAVLVGCGMIRMNLARFLLVNLLATLPKSALLFALGYFASGYLPDFEDHEVIGTAILAALGLAAVALIVRRGHGAFADSARR